MISGFTHPRNEFATPYRVINYHTCNSCWNDPLAGFDRHDFFSCPRHKDTARQFKCTWLITAEQVIATIKRIPAFARRNVSRTVTAPERANSPATTSNGFHVNEPREQTHRRSNRLWLTSSH